MKTTRPVMTTQLMNDRPSRPAWNCSFICSLSPGQPGQRLVVQRGDRHGDPLQVVKVSQTILHGLVAEQGLNFANIGGAFGRPSRDLPLQLLDRYRVNRLLGRNGTGLQARREDQGEP